MCGSSLRVLFLYYIMEKKTISKETLEKVKSLPRIDYLAFQMLVFNGQVERKIKFTRPRTIFFDEEINSFVYLNPYHKQLHICGKFIPELKGGDNNG